MKETTKHLFPTLQTSSDEFLTLIDDWKSTGLPSYKYSRMLQLSRRIARLLGEDHNAIINEALAYYITSASSTRTC